MATGKGGTDSLLAALAVEDTKRSDISRKLAELDGAGKAATLDGARLKRMLAKQVADVQALLGKNTAQARQALRKVLVEGRLRCEPLKDGRRGYRFSGRGSFGRLLAGAVTTDSNAGGFGGPSRGPIRHARD